MSGSKGKDDADLTEEEQLAEVISSLNELDPGLADTSARPHSSASVRSNRSWSSGKRSRAPQPPSSSRRSSKSCCAQKKTGRLRQKCTVAWWRNHPRQRKQMLMWAGFLVALLFTVILVSVVAARFSSGLKRRGTITAGSGEGDLYYRTSDAASDRYKSSRTSLAKENVVMLIGGRYENQQKSVEILTSRGVCQTVQGFPPSLPKGRTGHVAAATADFMMICGGLDPADPHASDDRPAISRKCWRYSRGDDRWKEVPGLRSSRRYAAAATSSAGTIIVMGGTNREGVKSAEVQIFDTSSFVWTRGSDMPRAAWGHCLAASDGSLISTGGWTDGSVINGLRSTFQYFPDEDEWAILPGMRQGRATHGCVTSKFKNDRDVVLVAGGMDYTNTPIASVEMLLLHGSRGPVWIRLGDLERPRSWYPAVAVLGNRLIVAGGKSFSPEDSVEEFSPHTRSFRLKPRHRLSWPRVDARSVVLPAASWYPNCVL